MSLFSLERTRIRLLKELLADAFVQRNQVDEFWGRAKAEMASHGEWRTAQTWMCDWPAYPTTMRHLRSSADRAKPATVALAELARAIAADEHGLRRSIRELVMLLVFGAPGGRGEREFEHYWCEVAPLGPPTGTVFETIKAGRFPPLPETGTTRKVIPFPGVPEKQLGATRHEPTPKPA